MEQATQHRCPGMGAGGVIGPTNFYTSRPNTADPLPAPTRAITGFPGLASLPRADWAFLRSCCSSDPARRLGAGGGGVHELKAHPFSVPSSGANWGVGRAWRQRRSGWTGLISSPLFACHFPAVALGQRMQGSLPFLVRTPPLGLRSLITTDQEGPLWTSSHLLEQFSVGAEGQTSQPVTAGTVSTCPPSTHQSTVTCCVYTLYLELGPALLKGAFLGISAWSY